MESIRCQNSGLDSKQAVTASAAALTLLSPLAVPLLILINYRGYWLAAFLPGGALDCGGHVGDWAVEHSVATGGPSQQFQLITWRQFTVKLFFCSVTVGFLMVQTPRSLANQAPLSSSEW